ncbi:MAG: hypothetical protein K2M60_08130 [Lachnospiraceae bacterium]|nr:hypothetical protein [Lachnospiraceae bacterium]MDE6252917.1 hypothetical protein [Lachnospiraceae bacterium]
MNLFQFENELIKRCDISKIRFHKVRVTQCKNIYQKITEKYADKTQIWKNGLHWANTNGYSPKSMKKLLGCYSVERQTWFFYLPEIILNDDMVYFLIDIGGDWYTGEYFWIFESYIPELVKVLDLLNQTAFLDIGWSDYYIVSKKFRWIIGFNHHNVISCVGEGLSIDCFLHKE